MSGRPSLPHLVLNVPAIARRSEVEVAQHLGPSDWGVPLTITPNGVKRFYRGGKIEVVFVDGVVRWIKLYTTGELPFAKEALAKLGLPVRRPAYENPPHALGWDDIPHLREVTLFGGGPAGSATAVLICVQTTEQARATGVHAERVKRLSGRSGHPISRPTT